MGTKAFLQAPRRRRSPLASLPQRVLVAAGIQRSRAAPARRRVEREGRDGRERPGVIVLGVDPGTIVVGYGAIEVGASGPRLVDTGAFRADRRAPVPARLCEIQRHLTALLERLRPAVVVVERAFAAKNVQAALRIGEGRGVILACAAASGAEVVEITPATAKKAVVGHGGADKFQVARMAAAALGLRAPPRPLDASDALALALAHVYHRTISAAHGNGTRRT